MAFQQGLSGLNSSAKALDVIGNNVANSSTVGFKAAEGHFADVYAASLGNGGASQIGIGTNLAAIMQQFTQGNVSTTNNTLDIAINGNGFFRLSQNGAVSYSRNGQFHLDKNGYIVNDQNLRLTGYPAGADGTIRPQTPTELQITPDLLSLNPVATGSSVGGEYRGVRLSLALDSRENSKTWTAPPAAQAIPSVDPAMYNYSTAQTIYDTLGNAHTLTYYFVKEAATNSWRMYGSVDGTSTRSADGNTPLNMDVGVPVTFNTSGQLVSFNGDVATPFEAALSFNINKVVSDLQTANPSVPNNGAAATLAFNINFTGSTQTGQATSVKRMLQDGYSAGNLNGMSISSAGVIQGRYSNGQTRNIGQMVLANFDNPNGLQSIGGNQWIETSESGQPTVGSPGSGRLGAVQSNAVEESNVDLTSELVKMITQQRNYQANSQTIKTQDQIMQTIVNLR